MQKRIVSISLILILMLSVVACGKATSTVPTVPDERVDNTPYLALLEPSSAPTQTPEPTTSLEPGSDEMARLIFDTLMDGFGNRFAACAILGNMRRESRLCPWRYEMEGEEGYPVSREFIERINDDLSNPNDITRFYFSHYAPHATDRTGFGLCQWTDITRKERLYDYAVETRRNLDDPVMQCEFIIKEMRENYPDLFEMFQTSEDLDLLVNYFCSVYEKGIATEANMYWRLNAARWYFQKYYPDEAKPRNLRPFESMVDEKTGEYK